MVLITFSILGFSIIAMASSSVKLSDNERDDQSVFYIAEAGLTVKIEEIEETVADVYSRTGTEAEFFYTLNSKIIEVSKPSTAIFEKTIHGKEPKALITVEELNTGNPREYKVGSIGTIGDSSRSVNAIIQLTGPRIVII